MSIILGNTRYSRANERTTNNFTITASCILLAAQSLHAVRPSRLRTRITHGALQFKSRKMFYFGNAIAPSRGNKTTIFVTKHIRSASAMPCNVSPHLTSHEHPTFQFHITATRHDDYTTLDATDTFSERAIPWAKRRRGTHATCRCPHFVSLSLACEVGNEGRSYRAAGLWCTSALGLIFISLVSCCKSGWLMSVVDADKGSLPRIGAG